MSPLTGSGDWHDNAIFRQVLGICSTLAVTNLVLNSTVMCTALILTTALSCLTVSLLRSFTARGRVASSVCADRWETRSRSNG